MIKSLIAKILSSIFGQFSWVSPPWLTRIFSTKPRAFFSLFCLFSIIFSLSLGYIWYLSKPKLKQIEIVIAPLELNVEKPAELFLSFTYSGSASDESQSVAPLDQLSLSTITGIHVKPDITGVWHWGDDSHLIFTPKSAWPAGQAYRIDFDKAVFANPKKLASLHAQFTTPAFAAKIDNWQFYQNPEQPDILQAVGTVSFNYPVNKENLSAKISVISNTMDEKTHQAITVPLQYTLSFDDKKNQVYLHTENLTLNQSGYYLDLNLDKHIQASSGPSSTEKALEQRLHVPSLSSIFEIQAVNTDIVRDPSDLPQQVLMIETSLGCKAEELEKAVHVYALPQDSPPNALNDGEKNHAWSNPGEITPAILALSKPVSLKSIPADRDYATLHSFQYQVSTPQYLYIQIDKGIKSLGHYSLDKNYQTIVAAPNFPQEIRFLHPGSLIALNSDKKISMLMRGIPGIKISLARILPNDVNQLITQSNGDFKDPEFINAQFTENNISEIFAEKIPLNQADLSTLQYRALDIGQYLNSNKNLNGPRGLFVLSADGWDPKEKDTPDVHAKRLILLTDLGLIVKDNADETHDIFVQSIETGKPEDKVSITVLGKNGLEILSRVTDSTGRAQIPSLKDFEAEREPVAYLAKKGDDVSFIPYHNDNLSLNYSRDDIGGIQSKEGNTHHLRAYLFSDRGIYRPGDKIHFAMIIKQGDLSQQKTLAGLPLEAILTNPNGSKILDQKFSLDATGLSSLDFQSEADQLTGKYLLSLFIAKDHEENNFLGSTAVQLQEFQPDSLKIQIRFSKPELSGWVSPENLSAIVDLNNLYGNPAADHLVQAKLELDPSAMQFDAYPEYHFHDPLRDPKKPAKVFTQDLDPTKTDDQGRAIFNIDLSQYAAASYQLRFFAEGFVAEGGKSVRNEKEILVSPLPYLIGYHSDADLQYIKKDLPQEIKFIAINPELTQITANDLTLSIYAETPVSSLVKNPDGRYTYQTLTQSKLLSRQSFLIDSKGSNLKIDTGLIGEYALVITNKTQVELSRINYSIVGAQLANTPSSAELQVKLNKKEYLPDDMIEMEIQAPYAGNGLITIEKDKVYAQTWFQASSNHSVQRIQIPKDLEGNAYVNIAYVRDWKSPEIFVNPLSYKVIPFTIDHAAHEIPIQLTVPTEAKPGETLTIQYQTSKPSKIIIFAVDEGILQVAQYQTPDPLAFFFQKEALEVTTQQTLDQILPQFIQSRELSAVGGDMASNENLLKSLNPFKRKTDLPVVFWSGVLDADNQVKEVQYLIPDYFNGALRVMAVAVNEDGLGASSQKTQVKADLIIQANVPEFAAPGDEFDVTASVTNNIKNSGNDLTIKLSIASSAGIQIMGDDSTQLTIAENKEVTSHFKVKIKDSLGDASLQFQASTANYSNKLSTHLSVRPANPYLSQFQSGFAEKPKRLDLNPDFYREYYEADAALANNPLIFIFGLSKFLDHYPYECSEQISSKGFALLSLSNQTWESPDLSAVKNSMQSYIQLLIQRQNSEGGFAYWPGMSRTSSPDFVSVYVMHFLTEAKEAGFNVPNDVMKSGLSYLQNLAEVEPSNLETARVQAYALYVLTRNEIVTTNDLMNLQENLDKHFKNSWQTGILSAYLASTNQLLKNFNEANQLIDDYQPKPQANSDFNNTDLDNAIYLYLIAKHFPDHLAKANTWVQTLVNALNNESINTLFSGYASLAFKAFSDVSVNPSSNALSMLEIMQDGTTKTVDIEHAAAKLSLPQEVKQLEFSSKDSSGYYYQLMQTGYQKTPFSNASKAGIEVTREYQNANHEIVTTAKLGEELEAHIHIRALNNQDISNVAILDLLPGGFEFVLGSSNPQNDIDYVDQREDRVIYVLTATAKTKELVYKIKANNRGKYVVPAVTASAMYNPKVQSHDKSSTIEVE